MGRLYEQTHPWITFNYRPDHSQASMRMGEAFSACFQLAGTPLQPHLARQFASIYLNKGVQATTAIEGNTLSADAIDEIVNKNRKLPPSQQYLEQEVRNVAEVLSAIREAAWSGDHFRLTPQWLKSRNGAILAQIDVADHVHPGEFTTTTLLVGNVYRGAPPEDVPYLVDRLCDWVNARLDGGQSDSIPGDLAFFNAVTTAILAHLYLVWIHPFGDGNGRTARAVECAILATSGMVPWVSSNLLSDHYNRTRSHYYERLASSSRNNDVQGFVDYALSGFVDMLREQITEVQRMQRRVAWVNYIHEVFQHETQGEASRRRRMLVLAMDEDGPTPRSQLRHLSAELAETYAGRSDKTLSHDLNRLRSLGLVAGDARTGYSPLVGSMDAFLPENNHP
ncbi:MAG: Fic family protein [Propionibacteriaceae bacterium]|jgi:Fic family protein|nr:Fic family protein [Propionibacteriaceae bacterium]